MILIITFLLLLLFVVLVRWCVFEGQFDIGQCRLRPKQLRQGPMHTGTERHRVVRNKLQRQLIGNGFEEARVPAQNESNNHVD